jgi:hypothetical protein
MSQKLYASPVLIGRHGGPSARTYRARLRAAFIRPEMSRRRATAPARVRVGRPAGRRDESSRPNCDPLHLVRVGNLGKTFRTNNEVRLTSVNG